MELDRTALLRRTDALREGMAPHEIRGLYSSGGWKRLGNGAYVYADHHNRLDDRARHLLRIHAVVPKLAEDAVVSHDSAAVVHGLPLYDVDLSKVHVTRNRRRSGRTSSNVVTHCALIDEIAVVNDIRVTTLERTVADISRTRSLDTAVVVGDAALRVGAELAVIAEELNRARRRKGIAQARRVASMIDGRSESVGESLGRLRLLQHGFTEIEPQVDVYDERGRFIGRIDYLLLKKICIEFDGKVKYQRYLKPGEDAGDAVFAEKKREDRLRGIGHPVVRFTWADLFEFGSVAQSIRDAVELAERSPAPRGTIRSSI